MGKTSRFAKPGGTRDVGQGDAASLIECLHPMTINATEFAWRVAQAKQDIDGLSPSERLRDLFQDWAEREVHAATLVHRALAAKQVEES
jgi:hypothetical protein